MSGHPRGVQAIAFVPGAKSLFSSGYENESGGYQNTLKLWEVETGTIKILKVYLDVPPISGCIFGRKAPGSWNHPNDRVMVLSISDATVGRAATARGINWRG